MTTDPSSDALARVPVGKWARTLAEMSDVLLALFLRSGWSGDDAIAQARTVVIELAQFFGGRPIYIPNGKHLRVALRDAEIHARAYGTNADELAKQFDLSVRRVQQIVNEQRELRRAQCRSSGDAQS